jgi:hypothetical protein
MTIRPIGARRLLTAALLAAAAATFVYCGSSTSPTQPSTATLVSLSLTPSSVAAGNTSQGTVTLSTGAPAGGATVALSSSKASVATVPTTIVIPQGSASATFTVTALSIASADSATISATYLGATQTATLSVGAVAVHADFVVTPDADTTVSAGQCSASRVSGTATQKLLCTFDASASTPSGAITEYRWGLPGMTVAQPSPLLKDQPIPCGGFSGAGTQKDITLTITAPGGTNSVTKSVTFLKGSPC